MSMKKGYCPKCKTKDQKRRVFDVNSEATICYCPVCMNSYKPSEAISAYNNLLEQKITLGYYQLHVLRRYKKAYQTFANILEFEPENAIALAGRINTLMYLSTLRKVYFNDIISLLNVSKHRFSLVSNRDTYLKLLTNLHKGTQQYQKTLLKRLTNKGFFYDYDCLRLYVYRLNQIKTLKTYIRDEFVSLKEENSAIKVSNSIGLLQGDLNKEFVTADGISRTLASFDENNNPCFNALDGKASKPSGIFIPATLNKNTKGIKIISDTIFNRKHKHRKMIITIISVGLAAIIASTVLFVLAGFINTLSGVFSLIASMLLLLAMLFIFVTLISKKKIKTKIKKKHISA